MEWLNNCATDTYVLKGFEEFAYIVCVVARPPQQLVPKQHDLEKTDREKLQNAERDLRAVSLLVALDPDKLELFMFYRKADLFRDQKSLTTKVGPILRANHCTTALKTFGNAANLLRPEHSRVYGLLIRAVLASVVPMMCRAPNRLPLGPRAFVQKRDRLPEHHTADTDLTVDSAWDYIVVDAQVLSTGQVLLNCTLNDVGQLRHLSEPNERAEKPRTSPEEYNVVLLAPLGQLGRQQKNSFGANQVTSKLFPDEGQTEPLLQKVWMTLSSPWITQKFPALNLTEGTSWEEIEIPTTDEDGPSVPLGTKVPFWQKIFWPATLCLRTDRSVGPEYDPSSIHEWIQSDPWDFAETWVRDAEQRDRAIAKAEKDKKLSDNEPDFPNEGAFTESSFVNYHGGIDFPPSQMIYPTPPDGPFTQPTPGMASIDGADTSPAYMPRPSGETLIRDDVRMSIDAEQMETSGIGSGYYDEDLFEEMPNDKFVPVGAVDEPNWDFFDQPGLEVSTDEPQIADTEMVLLDEQASPEMDEKHDPPLLPQLSPANVAKSSRMEELHPSQTVQDGHNDIKAVGTTGSTGDIAGVSGNFVADQSLDDPATQSTVDLETLKKPRQVKEGPQDSNTKYSRHGRYWFTATQRADASDETLNQSPTSMLRRSSTSHRPPTPSTSSSGSRSPAMSMDAEQVPTFQGMSTFPKWADYAPVKPASKEETGYDVNLQAIESEVKALLLLLEAKMYDFIVPEVKANPFSAPDHPLYSWISKQNEVAQIFVDQTTQTSFGSDLGPSPMAQKDLVEKPEFLQELREVDDSWDRVKVQQLALLGNAPPTEEPRIWDLENQQIHLRQGDKLIGADHSILPYWDTLGLQPISGEKTITAYCVYPAGANIQDGCRAFLTRLQEVYRQCKMGSVNIGSISDGLCAWSVDQPDDDELSLLAVCDALGLKLAGHVPESETTMVFMVNPGMEPRSYMSMCYAFFRLFTNYCKFRKHNAHDMALQIVPLSFVASPDAIVVPTQTRFVDLAIELYNRCPPAILPDKLAYCGSAVVLAESLSPKVDFEYTVEPISPLSKAGECLHCCYAYSPDRRWVSVTWTDERGLRALTMSYCLRLRDAESERPFAEVVTEIWEISHDLMAKYRRRWRLVIAKDEFYEAEEINSWLFQANKKKTDQRSQCTLVLLSLDLDPSLKIDSVPSPMAKLVASQQGVSPMQQRADVGTPSSTPQASTTTPEQMITATPIPTPGGQYLTQAAFTPPESSFDPFVDTDLTLVDPSAQSWGVVLSYGLNQSHNPLNVRPAIASGYLLKRKGRKDDEGVASLAINIVYCPTTMQSQTARDDLLREMIMHYRRLVTLAMTRGCRGDSAEDALPWHVHTAVKGARLLGQCL